MTDPIVVISSGLTNDFVHPGEAFQSVQVNIGRPEIDRLMGAGDHYGRGPLPSFIEAVTAGAPGRSRGCHILLRDLHDPDDPLQQPEMVRYGPHNLAGTAGAEFCAPIADAVPLSEIVETPNLSMPADRFHAVMNRFLGRDLLSLGPEDRQRLQFVVTGVYSNVLVLSIALRLRHDYRFPNVAVCPHLVGSKHPAAHLAALQSDFPNGLIRVVPDLGEMFHLAGAGLPERLEVFRACRLEPEKIAAGLGPHRGGIVETLFMFHSRVELSPLHGGFSGGLLLLARGEKDGGSTDPKIIKIDTHRQLQREIQGYNRVRDFMGKHAPALARSVSLGPYTGVQMDLAAMEGGAQTLQSLGEDGTPDGWEAFLDRYQRLLDLLTRRLYANTVRRRRISPYRVFGLHPRQQRIWLQENIGHILPEADPRAPLLTLAPGVQLANPQTGFETLTRHVDRVAADVSLCHGDLNFANLLTDERGNLWIIDWAFAEPAPLALDFAKMENDLKFVLSKWMAEADLGRLLQLERFLLDTLAPPEPGHLPPEMAFVTRRPEFSRLYGALRALRNAYGTVCRHAGGDLYAVALLRFAVHTLSFDARRGRGECRPPQLKYALASVCLLVEKLKNSALHRIVRQDRPEGYPERAAVTAHRADWSVAWQEYAPPYYEAQEVLDQERRHGLNGWADPETPAGLDLSDRPSCHGVYARDTAGRPLNPAGRTGLGGRGLLGRWGPNLAVDPVITRCNPVSGALEIVLAKRADTREWSLPGVMLLPGEPWPLGAARALATKTGLSVAVDSGCLMGWTGVEDYRNTDNAWIESAALHRHLTRPPDSGYALSPGAGVRDAAWVPLTRRVVDGLFANHARIVAMAMRRLAEQPPWGVDADALDRLLLWI